MRDGRMDKDGKNKSQHLGFMSTLKDYKKFEDSGSHRSREICNRKFDWRERKWINKGNGEQQEVDSLLHNATSHTQHLYQIS